jgi:hypothetical protein
MLEDMFDGILFVCLIVSDNHDEEVIGVCVARSKIVLQHDLKDFIEPYNTLRYIHIPDTILSDFTSNKNKYNIYPYDCDTLYEFTTTKTIYIYDKDSDHMIQIKPVSMPVVIDSLAKNKNYKDVGRFLIHNISKYYKLKGISTIYLGAESAYYRHNLIGKQCILYKSYTNKLNNTEEYLNAEKDIKDTLKLYKDSQSSLLNYYKSCGFKLVPNTYYVLNLLSSDNSISSIVLYNFYKLTI